jgi:hypothetical protein
MIWMLVVVAGTVAACDHATGSSGVPASSFDHPTTIVWGDTIQLEEVDTALIVSPRVTTDADGFLVTEFTTKQVRRYKGNGELEWQSGGEGDGPGEFKFPTGAVRMKNGQIIVSDMRSKLVTYSADGRNVLKTVAVPLSRIDGIASLDDEHVLLMAANSNGELAQVWNTRLDSIERSFFRGADHVRNVAFARSANFIVTARRGDTVAIAFSISDSIYFHNIDGTRLGAIRIPADSFRIIPDILPADRLNTDLEYRKTWLKSFDTVSFLSWQHDGSLIVCYGAFAGGGVESAFTIHTTRAGTRLMERRTPVLLAADANSDRLYFRDPSAAVPDRWIIATIH